MTGTTKDILTVEYDNLKAIIVSQEANLLESHNLVNYLTQNLKDNVNRLNDISLDLGQELYQSAILPKETPQTGELNESKPA